MRITSILFLSFAVMACKPQAAPASAMDGQMDRTAHATPKGTKQESGTVTSKEAPPRPGDVLYMIYGIDGDGASSYPVQNGSVATYWAGHEFTFGGKRYFTGFAYNTPQKFNGDTKVDPDAGVTLTEATFELRDPGTAKPWMFIGNEYWIGDYGMMEHGPKFDGSRQILEYLVDERKLLIAIPSIDGEAPDLIQQHYQLFSYSPAPPKNVEGKRWNYLGQVLVGEDYTAVCKAHPDLSCAKWTAALKFEGNAHGTPTINLVPEGTVIDDDTGESRKVDRREAPIYVMRDGQYGFK